MGKLLRRIRGALGMGITWAFAWSFVGLIPRWVLGINTDAPIPLIFGLLGFVSGITFSALLVVTEGRRKLDEITLPRFALWGAAGGLLLSGVFAKMASLGFTEFLALAPTLGIASAICASGSLALAKRARVQELQAGNAEAQLTSESHN